MGLFRIRAIPDPPFQSKMARSAGRAELSDDVARARCFWIGLTSERPVICILLA